MALIREATLSFTARFLNRRDPLGRELADEATAAAAAIPGDAARDAASEKAGLSECRLHTAHLLTGLELFLDQHRLRRWMKDDPEARQVRTVGQRYAVGQVGRRSPEGTATYAAWLEQPDPGVVANTIVCLLHQLNYLLDRQIRLLAQGFTLEPNHMPRPRPQPGAVADRVEPALPVPECPVCGQPMIERTARRGPRAGGRFWGCTHYPRCRGIRPNEKAADLRPRP